MKKYKVESGVPVKSLKGRPHVYPFDKMEVGQSFRVEIEDGDKPSYVQTKLATLARRYALRHAPDKKFTTSVETLDDKKGVRVWRVK